MPSFLNRKRILTIRLFTLTIILQSIYPIVATIISTPEIKNGYFSRITWARLAIILFIVAADLICLVFSILVIKKEKAREIYILMSKRKKLLKFPGISSFLILWITLWLPSYRLGQFSEEYVILKPIIQWICIVGIELFLVLSLISSNKEKKKKELEEFISLRQLLLSLIISLLFAGIILLLQHNIKLTSGITEPAAPPISPLQVFLLLIAVFLFHFSGLKNLFPLKTFLLLTSLLLYAIGVIKFLSTDLPCTGDLVGLNPPNYKCYPDIRDAVYSIGSLYTFFGEGIFNQWPTDKPLYMLFLAVCQWISNIQFENYMRVQVLILSFMPVGVFFLAKKISDYLSAMFASLLTIFAYSNSILLYSKLGGANIKLPLSEVLTAFMLVTCALVIRMMFMHQRDLIWAFIAGFAIGLAVLTRFNAILIIPLLGLLILASERKNIKYGVTKFLCFVAAVILILLPWVVINPIIKDDMTSSYLDKIQHILRSRGNILGQTEMIQTASLTYLSPYNPAENALLGYGRNILLHFTNNLISTFFSLPVNLTFHNLDFITDQAFWARDTLPLWQKTINPVQISLWTVTVFLFIWGALRSLKKFGFAGLSGLIVFLGYLLGNSFALTSGGRYLVPAVWVLFVYFSIGLIDIIKSIYSFIGRENENKPSQRKDGLKILYGIEKALTNIIAYTHKRGFEYAAIAMLLLPGFILSFMQLLPDKFPPERTEKTESKMYSYLEARMDSETWQNFLREEDSFISEGLLFFPQYFDQAESPIAKTNDVFEVMVMGKEYVYMSYMYNQIPKFFTNGSRVLMAGCKIREGFRFGINRRVVHAYAIIQMEHENQLLIDPQASWNCKKIMP